VFSFDFTFLQEPFQIDFIGVKNIPMGQFYFNYSDVGNILGKICNSIQIKFGHLGLWINISNRKIFLTKNPEEICNFLELDYSIWKNGFYTQKEIFNWIITTKYFKKNIFTNFNYEYRKREEKRPFFNHFLEFIKVLPDEEERNVSQQDYAIIYFDKTDELNKLNEEMERKRILSEKFNGRMFLELGFTGKEIGVMIEKFKKSFINFDEILESKTKEEIKEQLICFTKNELLRSNSEELQRNLYKNLLN